jgi:hypothetical protein
MFLFVPLCVTWFIAANRTSDVLMNPQVEPAAAVLGAAAFVGLMIGYCQFAAERWRKTIGYVLHRGTSDGHVFVAKTIAGLCATAFLAIGPPIVYALVHMLTSEDRPIFQMQRVVELAWLSTLGVSAYGLGALVSQLHRAWWKEVLFGLVCVVALASIALRSTIMTSDDPTPHAVRYVAIQLAIGIVLLAVAFRLFMSRGDRDLPLPGASHAVIALLGILLFFAPLDFAAAAAEREWIQELRQQYPVVLRERAAGRLFAAAPTRRGEYLEVDGAGRIAPDATPLKWSLRDDESDPYELVYQPTWKERGSPFDSTQPVALNGSWVGLRFVYGTATSTVAAANGRFIVEGYLDLHAGVFRVFFTDFPYGRAPVSRPDLVLPRGLPMEVVIEKPRSTRRFSGHTVCLQRFPLGEEIQYMRDGGPPEYDAVCAVDLDDRSLWRIDPLDLETPAREVTLPGGDRFVRLESAHVSGEVHANYFSGWYEVRSPSKTFGFHGSALIVAGKRGLYAWNGDEFQRFERGPGASPGKGIASAIVVKSASELESHVDPLEPSIEVRSAGGSEVLFRYDYSPRREDGITVALIYMANLVRSPLTCVTSAFTTARNLEASVAASRSAPAPLLYNRHRPWLLIAVLALAVHSTRKVIQTLARRGAGGWTIGVWAVVTAVFGVYAYLLFRLLEPRGKPSLAVETPATAPVPMLIESRAQERAPATGSM